MRRITTLMIAALLCIAIGEAKTLKTKLFHITPGMECSNCENRVRQCIGDVEGVTDVVTDTKEQTVSVTYDADITSSDKIAQAFAKINYNVSSDNKRCENKACENFGKECIGSCISHPCGNKGTGGKSGCDKGCTD